MSLRMIRRNRKGFTLIELLIVISILVILSVAVAMNFIGFDYDARHSSTKSNIGAIRSAIGLYRSRHSQFPQPAVSGGAKATQVGEKTLEAILTNSHGHGDGTEYIRGNIAGELITSGQGVSWVCVVQTMAEFYADQSTYDACIAESSEDGNPGDSGGSGYLYCPINGAIRLNFTVQGDDLREEDQMTIESIKDEWSNWADQNSESEGDWPVKW